MIDLVKFNDDFGGLHDSWIISTKIEMVDKHEIEVIFKSYDYEAKVTFKNVEDFMYGLKSSDDFIIYEPFWEFKENLYTFSTCNDFESHEKLDYLYIQCRDISYEKL